MYRLFNILNFNIYRDLKHTKKQRRKIAFPSPALIIYLIIFYNNHVWCSIFHYVASSRTQDYLSNRAHPRST